MKKSTVISVLIATTLLIGGCSKSVATTSTVKESSESTIDLSKVTLIVGDQANGSKTKLEAAKALEGVPYKIQWANFQGAGPLFEAVRSGKIDTAPAGDTPVLFAAAAGVPIKIVATNVSSPKTTSIIVPKNSPIKSIAQLKGKTVVVSSARGSVSEYLLIEALKEAGLTIKDVKVRYMLPTDALVAFISGKIDVWATFSIYYSLAEAQGARLIRDGENINTGLSFITASEKALADPAKVAAIKDFLQRSAKATEWTNTNKDEYIKVYSKTTRSEDSVARSLITRQGKQVTRTVQNEDIVKLQKVADVFYDEKALPKKVDVKTIVNQSIFSSK